jgi:hypothetical protein
VHPAFGIDEVTAKMAPENCGGHAPSVGAADGAVGADVGGSEVPGWIEMVSIEMSPVNDVVRLASHRTDVVPGGSSREA